MHICMSGSHIYMQYTCTCMYYIYMYIGVGKGGLLIHCISGWDRTPLFISLLRLSLWAVILCVCVCVCMCVCVG